jgi:hypothetical protein
MRTEHQVQLRSPVQMAQERLQGIKSYLYSLEDWYNSMPNADFGARAAMHNAMMDAAGDLGRASALLLIATAAQRAGLNNRYVSALAESTRMLNRAYEAVYAAEGFGSECQTSLEIRGNK